MIGISNQRKNFNIVFICAMGGLLLGYYISLIFAIVLFIAGFSIGYFICISEKSVSNLRVTLKQKESAVGLERILETQDEIREELQRMTIENQNKVLEESLKYNESKEILPFPRRYNPMVNYGGKVDQIHIFGAEFAHRHGVKIDLDEWMETQGIYSSVHKRMIIDYLEKLLEDFSPNTAKSESYAAIYSILSNNITTTEQKTKSFKNK